jgi:type II secretory pathway predicted ATPase ExeA
MHNMEQQLRGIAQAIAELQVKLELSDARLCRRFGSMGSSKTYKKILNGDFEGLAVERQLHNYQQALTLVEMAASGERPIEEDIAELSQVERAEWAVRDALQELGNNRLVIIEGPSGAGKSTIARLLQERWPNQVVMSEADETWKNSPSAMLTALLIAVGPIERRSEDDGPKRSSEVAIPVAGEERKRKLFEALNVKKRILIVDEGHHLGQVTLNLLKTLINQTPTVVVLLAIPTLLRRLEGQAYEEARQLTKNRMCERVHVNGPEVTDVVKFLGNRGVKFADDKTAKACAAQLAKVCVSYGHWNFVNLVSRKGRRASARGPLDVEGFVECMTEAQKTR